jgi:hypothetical protein
MRSVSEIERDKEWRDGYQEAETVNTHTQNLQNRVFETSQSVENLCCILSVGCEENFSATMVVEKQDENCLEDVCVCVCVRV